MERGDEVIVVIVGNKSDLSDKRQVTSEDVEKLCADVGALFHIETSTKANHNVKALFKKIAAALPDAGGAPPEEKPEVVDIKVEEPTNTSSCC